MDEKLEALKRCLKTANDEYEIIKWEFHRLPDYANLEARRCEMEAIIEIMKNHNLEHDDYEKDLTDFMGAHNGKP